MCWVTPRAGVAWVGAAPGIRVAEPEGDAGWTVADGLGRFDELRGAWLLVHGTSLATFVRWAMEEKVFSHSIISRYRRVHVCQGRKARRIDIWTSERSIAAEKRHDAMRRRQEEWRVEQERKAARAERDRMAREQAVREAHERERQIEQEARRVEAAEKQRLWKIERDRQQARLEAERLARQEEDREAERRERELREEAEWAERERLEQVAAQQ